MSKLLLTMFAVLLVSSFIMAAPDKSNCGRHGDPCVSDRECCSGVRCHVYAHKCQVEITAEDLRAQREKLRPTGIKLY